MLLAVVAAVETSADEVAADERTMCDDDVEFARSAPMIDDAAAGAMMLLRRSASADRSCGAACSMIVVGLSSIG